MKLTAMLRYAAVLSLLVGTTACNPQSVPIGDEIHVDLSAQAAPAAAPAANARTAG
ncbi:hypothetical protein ABU614_18575 [Lysobacter firmicutimachus]|uniref:Uncharacterized protein n=1 Tax=Lysobacter firmicutimachus TaxID=1792846 RepID=A0AAU8MRY2_9GAMM